MQQNKVKMIKHDLLSYQKIKFFAAANQAHLDQKILICGYLYVDNIESKEITVDSGTGYQYVLELPDEFLNKSNSSQFNVSLKYKELKMNN